MRLITTILAVFALASTAFAQTQFLQKVKLSNGDSLTINMSEVRVASLLTGGTAKLVYGSPSQGRVYETATTFSSVVSASCGNLVQFSQVLSGGKTQTIAINPQWVDRVSKRSGGVDHAIIIMRDGAVSQYEVTATYMAAANALSVCRGGGGGGGSADDWGLQVVQTTGSTLSGNGTSGSPMKVADGGIGATQIADNAVTTSKIANGTILMSDFAQNGATIGQSFVWNGAAWTVSSVSGSGDNWGSQYVKVDSSTIFGRGTSLSPLTWGGAYTSGPLTGSGTSLIPLNVAGNSITATHIANDAIDSTEIQSGAVQSSDIADGQVWSNDLAANVVDSTKLAPSSVQSSDIADGQVWSNDLASNSVTTEKIANGTILGADLAQNSAASGQMLKWNGSTWAAANDSIMKPLASAHIFVGNASSVATDVAMSGDVSITNTGATTVSGGSASSFFLKSGVQYVITGTVNDLSLSSPIARFAPSAADLTLTGISNGGGQSPVVLFVNDGTKNVILKNSDPGSSSGNRFVTPSGLDYVLKPGDGSVMAKWGASAAWHVMSDFRALSIDTLTYASDTLKVSVFGDNVPAKKVYIPSGGAGVSTGDKGEIDVVNAASDWRIDTGAVTTIKIADAAVTMAKVAQTGATSGQVIKWNGSAWAPAVDNTAAGYEETRLSDYVRSTAISVDSVFYKTNLDNIEVVIPYGDGDATYMKLDNNDDFRHFTEIYAGKQIDAKNKDSYTGTWVFDNSISYASTIGSTFTASFRGKSLYFQYYSDPSGGRWQFNLDSGAQLDTVDTYSASAVLLNRTLVFSGLSNATHTVTATLISSNPASSGNKGWILNYTAGVNAIENYSTLLTNSTSVCDFVLSEYNIQESASYYEFAINIRPANNPSATTYWIPSHSGVNTCFYTGDSLKIYADGARITTSITGFQKAKYLNVSQNMNGFYADSVATGKQYAEIKISHIFSGYSCNIVNKIIWKRPTYGIGYLMMGPISRANFDTLYTSLGQKVGLKVSDGSTENINYERATSQFLFKSNATGKVSVLQTINDGGIKRSTKSDVRSPLCFLEHRNTTLQKLYAQSFSAATMNPNDEDYANFTLNFYKEATPFGSSYQSSSSGGGGGGGGGSIDGGGSTNTIAKFVGASEIGNSTITDDGSMVSFGGTAGIRLANGTDAQRPSVPSSGDLRYNTTNGNAEFYGASAWEFPAKAHQSDGLLGAANLIAFASPAKKITSISGFSYEGSSVGLLVNGLQINGGGTSTSYSGQGFAVAGANRQLRILASGANETAGDASALYFRVGNISRTASSAFTGILEDVLQVQSGSSVTDFTFKKQTAIYNRAMTTIIGNDYDCTINAGVTNHYAAIYRKGWIGIGTATPRRSLDILDASAPQLRITYSDNAKYADFKARSDGYLEVSPKDSLTIFGGAVQVYGTESTCKVVMQNNMPSGIAWTLLSKNNGRLWLQRGGTTRTYWAGTGFFHVGSGLFGPSVSTVTEATLAATDSTSSTVATAVENKGSGDAALYSKSASGDAKTLFNNNATIVYIGADASDSSAVKIGRGTSVGSTYELRASTAGVSIGNNPTAPSTGAALCVQGRTATEQLMARGSAPTATFTSAAGSSGTATVSYGGDMAFHVSFSPGDTPGTGDYITITFAHALPSGKKPIVMWADTEGTFKTGNFVAYTPEANKSASAFRIKFSAALPAGSHEMDIHVISN